MHPIVYARNPDEVLYDADLGDAAWEAKTGINALSDPGHLRPSGRGRDQRTGFAFQLGRGTFPVRAGEQMCSSWSPSIPTSRRRRRNTSKPRETLTITYSSNTQAFTAVKTAVDAITGISSSYYGNATAADDSVRNERPVRRRTHVLVLCPGDGHSPTCSSKWPPPRRSTRTMTRRASP